MGATFWHEMTGKDLLNYRTIPMQGPVVLKGCPATFTSSLFKPYVTILLALPFTGSLGNFSATWLTHGTLQTSLCA